MTLVSGSPSEVAALATTLEAAADAVRQRTARLCEAIERLAASPSDVGPLRCALPGRLRAEPEGLAALGEQLERFVRALLAADANGAGLGGGRLAPWPSDIIVTSALAVEANLPLPPSPSLGDVVESLSAQRDLHIVRRPQHGPFPSMFRRWEEQLARLNGELRQLEAIANPRFEGWAGVNTGQWTSWRDLSDARRRALGLASSLLRAGVVDAELGWPSGPGPAEALGLAHPFLSAALQHDVLLTPDRVAVLDDLDALATMPLEGFLRERTGARERHPSFDWTADGCSGPIPADAQDTCLRHDFMYRNARMVRDQWGIPDGFATDIKARADALFGRELEGSFAWWQRWSDSTLWVWLEGAEVAVEWFGDVEEQWTPPAADAFFGSVEPG